jgi:hypothetical protein
MPRQFTPTSKRSVQLHVMVPLPVVEDLTALATIQDCTLSDLLRQGIELVLAQQEQSR